MSYLSKLTIKSVKRTNDKDPVLARRQKLTTALEEQLSVLAAALQGNAYEVASKRWDRNEQGEKVLVEKMRKVRPWFFEQDGGFYVNCKYGNRVLELGKDGNAVFVKSLADVKEVFEAFKNATDAGEFDDAVAAVVKRKPRK